MERTEGKFKIGVSCPLMILLPARQGQMKDLTWWPSDKQSKPAEFDSFLREQHPQKPEHCNYLHQIARLPVNIHKIEDVDENHHHGDQPTSQLDNYSYSFDHRGNRRI